MEHSLDTSHSAHLLKAQNLQRFFIEHLNKWYCIKSHLVERLSEIAEQSTYADVRLSIDETINKTEYQLNTLGQIYTELGIEYSFNNCDDLVDILETSFATLQLETDSPDFRYLYMLAYLSLNEKLELSSFQILQVIAGKLKNEQVNRSMIAVYKKNGSGLQKKMKDRYMRIN